MAIKFNPFTAQFDLTGSSGGASYIDGEVANYSALPVTVDVPPLDSAYLVRASQGIWPISYKPAGIYYRKANEGALSDWAYAGTVPDVFSDANFLLYDETDTSKNAQFQLSGITTGTTRTMTVPDASGTLQLTGHASAHATTGSDPLSPAAIGAQSIFTTEQLTITTTDTITLTAARAKVFEFVQYAGQTVDVRLPETGAINGDVFVFKWGTGENSISVRSSSVPYGEIATVSVGEQKRFQRGAIGWTLTPVDTHTHTASAITDSTTAGRALLTASTVENQRTALALGSAATKNVGTGSTDVAAGDHTHSGVYATASHTHELDALAATGAASGKVLTSDGDGTASWQDAAAGGIAGTTSTDNAIVRADSTANTVQESAFIVPDNYTVSPNDTVNHASIQATGASTNVSVSIVAKGTGSFSLHVPDGSATGGNARGANSVDLQKSRNNAIQCASGNNAVIIGGSGCIASGLYAIAGGTSCWSQNQAAVALGSNNISNGVASVCISESSEATSNYSGNLAGSYCKASAINAATLGGNNALADRLALHAHSAGKFANQGDAQRIRAVLRCKTTTNAAVEMALNGTTTYLTIPSGKVLFCRIQVVGVKSDGSAVATYERQYAAKNVGGTSSEVFAAVTIGTDNAANTSLAISTNDTGDYISIQPTGIASQTWRWVASVDAVEVAYGA